MAKTVLSTDGKRNRSRKHLHLRTGCFHWYCEQAKVQRKRERAGDARCLRSSFFVLLLGVEILSSPQLTTMPSKLRKAIGAVKDQTSIGLAKVSSANCSNLDVAILKATTHEEVPVEDRYVNEVLLLVSSSRGYAAACVHALAKRISRTRNWIVALKSLMLILKLFQEGDTSFLVEVLHAMKKGSKLLNLSSFRDDSNSSPWDYTAFVRTFALYLDERLDCSLMGKLQLRMNRERARHSRRRSIGAEPVCEMKPEVVLDKIIYWQRLLDRVLATRPTGPAKNNRLVQISLYSVVRESFDLYRDISDGLALLLDSFFHLQHQVCVDAFETCKKAAKQFDELASFYGLCKSIGVGRTSEYPSVQMISEKLLETLQEFLKDHQISLHHYKPKGPKLLLPPTIAEEPIMEEPSSSSETKSDVVDEAETEEAPQKDGELPQLEDLVDMKETSVDDLGLSLVLLDEDEQRQEAGTYCFSLDLDGGKEGWELALVESVSNMSTQANYNMGGGFDSFVLGSLYDQAALYHRHQNYNNPFLHSGSESSLVLALPSSSSCSSLLSYSSFHSTSSVPTFCAQNANQATTEDDPFSASLCVPPPTIVQISDLAMKQQLLIREQQLWMQQQNKIIGRRR